MKATVKDPGISKTTCLELGTDVGKIDQNLGLAWRVTVRKTPAPNVGVGVGYARWAQNDLLLMGERFPKSKSKINKVVKELRAITKAKKTPTKKKVMKQLVRAANMWRPIRNEAYKACT